MTEKSIKRNLERDLEWDLAFAPDEVVPRLEKLFRQHGYAYTQEEKKTDILYHTSLGQGTLDIGMHPLEPKKSPFSASIFQQRTLAFLRVGG